MERKSLLDMRLVTFSILLLVLCMPVFSFIHEMGHGLVCKANGGEFTYGIALTGAWLTCDKSFENPKIQQSFRFAGGFLASAVAFVTFLMLRGRLSRKFIFIPIALLAIGITEYSVMVLEGFANDFYMNNRFSTIIPNSVLLVTVVTLAYRFSFAPTHTHTCRM